MPTQFSFSDGSLLTPSLVVTSQLTTGSGPGVNVPTQASAVAPNQLIDFAGDVDVVALTLIAGRTYTLDIDGGAGDASGGSVDLELDLIDSAGGLVLNVDGSGSLDAGDSSTLDPRTTFTVNESGVYYVAVHSQGSEYLDGQFAFDTGGTGVGDYGLVISATGVPGPQVLSNRSDSRDFGGPAQNVQALDGNDRLSMGDGADFAHGNAGNDTLSGGDGSDELVGGAGNDRLSGNDDDDVLIGGDGLDVLFGNSNRDVLYGGQRDDRLEAGTSRDTLWGEAGNDSLVGGSGDDFLRGGTGVDIMRGGPDSDTFHFLQGEAAFDSDGLDEDRIVDFDSSDRIDLSDLVGGTLAFRGTSGFTGANQVRIVDYRDGSGNGLQEARVNLDSNTATVELAILVDTSGNFALRSDDFAL